MDDEDGRCLLDVICDPQALNDFLHGSEKIDSDDLLDNTGDAASAFFEGAGLHVQEAPGNHLTAEQSQPAPSVDLDFLEDDILGSPGGTGTGTGGGAEQPCDILQQSLQEANITEQTLEAEAELDLGSFQLPALQPVVPAEGAAQLFPGGADLLGLQPPAVLAPQALVQPPVGADVVNKAISVQPFLQQVGIGNVTIQPIPNLQGLPNGSPGGALGIGPIQVVGQQVMAINQPAPQILAKQVQPSPVATVPVGGYVAQPEQPPQQVTLASAGVSPQSAGLVIQKNLPAVAAAALNGGSVFGGVAGAPPAQPLAVTSSLSSPLVPAQNVIIHRTPTPIQPKPAGVLQQKLYQITPKPFGSPGAALAIPGDAALQPQPQQPQQQQQPQQKAQQNLTFKAGQNVVLSGFPPALPANVFKPPPQPQPPALSKPMSVQLLNQGSSIVIPAQHVPQAVNQFLLPPQLSALPANVGGQILAASHAGAPAHIIASQGASAAQLIANQALPAQILTNQNLAGQLNLGPVLASPNAHGTAHILSAPIQVGQPALFHMPVSLAGAQSQPAAPGQALIPLPNQVMLNAPDALNAGVSIQAAAAGGSSQSPGLLPAPPAPEPAPLLAVPAGPPAGPPAPPPPPAQPSPGLAASPDKIILGPAPAAVLAQDSMQMFLQQLPAGQQKLPGASPSHALPHPPLGETPPVPPALAPLQSPPPPRPPSQPQPLSRPPSRPLSRPPSEPLARPCTPQAPALFAPAASPHAAAPLPPEPPHAAAASPHFQLQFPAKPPTPSAALQLPAEPPRAFPMLPGQFQTLPAMPNPAPPPKQMLDRFPQVPQGIILQPKPQAPAGPAALGPFGGAQGSSVLLGQPAAGTPASAAATTAPPPPPASAGAAAAGSADGKAFASVPAPAKAPAALGKPGAALPVQPKAGVISSVPGLSLAKGPLQIQVVGKGLSQLLPAVPVQTPQLYDGKLGSLKKAPALQPSKEASFLEQLHKHQGAVLHPDYKTPFRSFEDALQRLLPYHVYQGALPSAHDYRKVDEEFETVSTQLLKRTQAMLNKYRLLLLEESRRVSPSAEMVMIDRMFIQEEKTMLALDKQLAKEKPDEYVSASRPQSAASPAAGAAPAATESLKASAAAPAAQLNPPKLVIKHGGGGSPSVTWAKAAPDDDDALPSRSKPPIKTYEARSRIGLKLKIKQEAGLSKVVHNTALDPVHQPPAPRGTKAPAAAAAAAQMNGTVEHATDKKPAVTSCRLPLRKTYRENVDAFAAGKGPRQDGGAHRSPPEKGRAEEGAKAAFPGRGGAADGAGGLMKELAEAEDEFYRGMIKAEPPDASAAAALAWEAPLPPKRRKSESPDVDNASFSSDSPQDDALHEHLQSAIDSILNLQQPAGPPAPARAASATAPAPAPATAPASPPFPAPPRRTDALLAPSHNGALGARTLNR